MITIRAPGAPARIAGAAATRSSDALARLDAPDEADRPGRRRPSTARRPSGGSSSTGQWTTCASRPSRRSATACESARTTSARCQWRGTRSTMSWTWRTVSPAPRSAGSRRAAHRGVEVDDVVVAREPQRLRPGRDGAGALAGAEAADVERSRRGVAGLGQRPVADGEVSVTSHPRAASRATGAAARSPRHRGGRRR